MINQKSESKSNPSKLYNPELGPLNDFKNFLYLVWMFLPSIGVPPTRIQYDIADALQHSKNPWTIIMAYRGIGKSYITAAFCVWLWLINPDFKLLVISAAQDKASNFSFLVKSIIMGMPECEHLRPRPGQRTSVLSFDVGGSTPAKDPSMNIYGINGQVTGGRADFIIPDDIEVPENSDTPDKREKLLNKLNEIIAIIKPARDGHQPQIKMLGTPQTIESVYFALKPGGFQIIIWPARYPKDMSKYDGDLAPILVSDLEKDPSLVGRSINPEMHPDSDLEQREQGRKAWFQLQYMLDPSLSDEEKYPLKCKDFIVANIDKYNAPVFMAWAADPRLQIMDPSLPSPGLKGDRWYRAWKTADEWRPYESRLMAIDPAGGGDETAYIVLYLLQGYIFIVEWGGIIGGSTQTYEKIASIAHAHKVNTVLIERNYGASKDDDGNKTSGFTELLKPFLFKKHRCEVEVVHVNTQKERRICDTLEPVLGTHRLIISEEVIKADYEAPKQELRGLYQLTHITRTKGSLLKDDRVDVLALGVEHYLTRLQKDVDKNEEYIKEERQKALFSKFMNQATSNRWSESNRDNFYDNRGESNYSLSDDLMEQAQANRPWWDI